MWMYTETGAYSVVAKGKRWQVRARVKDYLVHLMEDAGINEKIIVTPHRDYGFRIIVDRPTYVRLYTYMMENITYPDFKTHLGKTGFMSDSVNKAVYSGAYNTYWDEADPFVPAY